MECTKVRQIVFAPPMGPALGLPREWGWSIAAVVLIYISTNVKTIKERTMDDRTLGQRDKLMADLRVVVADAEELLKLGAEDMSEGSRNLRERMQQRLTELKRNVQSLQTNATERVKAAGKVADGYVHDNPWQSVALGAGAGLLVGLLIGRR